MNVLATCSELKPSYLSARRRKPEDANGYDSRPTTAILYFQTQVEGTNGMGAVAPNRVQTQTVKMKFTVEQATMPRGKVEV
jgi:hypothetical protein